VRVRAVCLDVDDTLVDFGGAALAALEHVLGAPADGALWHQLTEHHYGRYLAGAVDFPTMQLDRLAGVYAATGRAVPADLVEVDGRRLVELRARLRLFDDVAACLAELRAAGLHVAVVSNSDGPHQRAKLAAAGLEDAFDAVVVSGEVGVAKPAPEIFRHACTELGVTPAETVHVGDKLDTDARGARDAGLHGVWLDRAGVGGELPDRVHRVRGLDEVAGLVRTLDGRARDW
jgi:putative hydrolase of the HAD superfamily